MVTATLVTPLLGERQNCQNIYKFEQLKEYKVRDLDCGIKAQIHPRADEIARLTHEWFRETNQHTYFDEVTFQRLLDMDGTKPLCMTHPDSSFEGTLWMSKFVGTLYVADDYLEIQVGDHAPRTPDNLMIEWILPLVWTFPDESHEWVAKLLGLLEDMPEYRKSIEELCQNTAAEGRKHPFKTPYPGKLNPCGVALLELWQEAITAMPREWSIRFGRMWNLYACGQIAESIVRKEKKVLTMDEFLVHRNTAGGMPMLLGPCADFVDMNFNFSSEELFQSEKVQHLLSVSNLACCLFNDIYSFPKELRNGEYHNLVFLVSYWQHCSYNDAAEVVMKLVEDMIRDILATVEELTQVLSPEERRSLEPTIQACIHSIPAYNVFHKTSYRYSFDKPLVVVA